MERKKILKKSLKLFPIVLSFCVVFMLFLPTLQASPVQPVNIGEFFTGWEQQLLENAGKHIIFAAQAVPGLDVSSGTYGYLIFAAEELDLNSQSEYSRILGSWLANPKGGEIRVEGVQSGFI
jgi:hypothetical protein